MPNRIKYNPGIDENSYNIGNWSIGTDGTGMGPTSDTGFMNGAPIPEGGYAIYSPGPNVRVANNDTELVYHLNMMGAGVPDNDKHGALVWAKDNSILVLNSALDNPITEGLVFNLDARHKASFPNAIPTTNIAANVRPQQGGWSGFYSVVDGTRDKYEFVLTNYHENGAGWRSWLWDATPYIGQTVTISALFEGVRPGPKSNTIMNWLMIGQTREDGNAYLGYSRADQKYQKNDTEPERISWTGVIEGTSPRIGFTLWGNANGIPSSSLYLDISDIQIEVSSEVTPYVNGTRNQHNEWYDISGFNNTATINGNPTYNEAGYWEFRNVDGDGDFEYFIANFNDGVLKSTNAEGEWAIETVFRDMGSALGSENIIAGRVGHHSGILQKDSGGAVYAQVRTNAGGTGQAWISGGATTDGKWTHALMTYNNRVTRLYINGELMGEHTMSTSYTPYNHNDNFYIGGYPNNKYRSYTDIAVVRAYSKELPHTEVIQNLHGGSIVTNGLVFAVDAGNLVSYQKGSTTTYSLAGSDSGTLINDVEYSSGNGGTWSFNGADEYIRIPASSALGTSQITIAAWVYPTEDATTGGRTRGAVFGGPGSLYLGLWPNSSGGSSAIHTAVQTTSGRPSTQTGTIHTNQWSYLLATYDGVNFKTYLNGEYITQTSQTGNISSGSTYYIGTYSNLTDGNHNFPGKISCASIYNRALTQEEILQNYNATAARFK